MPNAGHDYIQGMNETVNPANGALSIRIGVPLPPTRGFNLPFNFAYDSNGADYLATPCSGGEACSGAQWVTTTSQLAQGGWSYSVPMLSVQLTSKTMQTVGPTDIPGSFVCDALINFVLQDMQGNRHNLGLSYFNSANVCQDTDNSTNSGAEGVAAFSQTIVSAEEGPLLAQTTSRWNAMGNGSPGSVNPVTVIDGDGTSYNFGSHQSPILGCCNTTSGTFPPDSITDRNGNGYSITYASTPGSPALTYTDSIGRKALSIPTFGASTDDVSVAGLSSPYQVSWTTVTPNFSVTMTSQGSTTCTLPTTQPTIPAVSSITLPNGKQYAFTYDPVYGMVNKITYPTGGYVRYLWGVNPQSEYGSWPVYSLVADPLGPFEDPIFYPALSGTCPYIYDTPAIAQRFVSFDGVNEVLEQDFFYTTSGWTANGDWSQKQTQVYTRDKLLGTSYETVYTYGWTLADDQPNLPGLPAQIPVETGIQYYDTNGNLLKTVGKQWGNERIITQQTTTLNDVQPAETDETDWTYNSNEMVTDRKDYDFGSSGHGSLLRETSFPSYAPFTTAQHIVDKPNSVQLLNSSGAVVAGVGYTYDANGNLLNRANWLTANGSSALNTSHTYDTYGNMLTTTDPQLNTTKYSYTNSFVDTCNFSPSPSAYLTGITYPTTTVAHTLSFQYYCNLGYLGSATDENGQTTSYQYNDPLGRLTQTTYPSGWGTSTITYTDTPNAVLVETQRLDGSGTVWADSVDLYDGIFHSVSHSQSNGESTPWDRTDTCYDGEGLKLYSVYPYQTTSSTGQTSCSGAHDTFAYDALGRINTVTHSDGSSALTSYAGRAVDVKDEGNGTHQVERITQSDALGRLSSVCEVTAQSQNGVSPAACGQDYSGTGFLTSYSYTTNGDLSSVTQGAENRSFTYDMTSRLLTASNPENGTLTYTYDADNTCGAAYNYNGELISKTDARGIRTCMLYDGLHRVTGKGYSYAGSPPTSLAATYNYDETSAFGKSLSYTTGRLSSESTGGANPTGSVFSYDNMGHVIDNSQCTPQNCASNSTFAVTYPSYNVLGEPNSSTDGAGNTLGYAYNSVGRLTGLNSTLNDPQHPGTLLANMHYNAYGSLLSSSIGSIPLADTRGYDTRGRLISMSVTDGSTTHSSGTFTISGNEQSTGGPTPGTATITINGEEASGEFCNDIGKECHYKYDSGAVEITINGTFYSVYYGQKSTPSSIASALAGALNSSLFSATVSTASNGDEIITIVSKATGTSANYSLSTSYYTSDPTDFGSASFYANPSGPTLTGGANTSAPFDSGTVTATVNGTAISVSYGQNDTSASVASALVAAINQQSPAVMAAASGSVVTLTSQTASAYTDYAVSVSSSSSNGFNSASFSGSPYAFSMTGGTGGSIYSLGVAYFPNSDVENTNDSVNGNWTYSYDDFNRLSTAVSNTGYGCAESYDLYGNRTAQTAYQGSCLSPQQYAPSLNNQYPSIFNYEPGLNGMSSGNVVWDGSHNYSYDAESRVSTVDGGSTATYVYDAEGRRVRKIEGGSTVDYLYDLSGHVITEINSTGGWDRGEVYAGGMHVATYDNGATYFTHSDWLGTERVRSTAAGGIYSTWTSLPFGEGSATADPSPNHLTGKQRDTESGLDFFGARYYAGAAGRFMSPDWSASAEPVPYAKLTNPQSLNLYSYVQNNPVNDIDANGHSSFSNIEAIAAGFGGGVYSDYDPAPLPTQNLNNPKPQQQSTTQTPDNTLEAQNNTPPPPGRTPAQGGTPGSTVEIPDGKGGKTVRKFGPDGKAETDIDHGHDHGAGDPHAHDWDWGKKPPRQPGRPLTPEEQKNVKRAAGGVTAGVIIYWVVSEASRILFPPRNLIPVP